MAHVSGPSARASHQVGGNSWWSAAKTEPAPGGGASQQRARPVGTSGWGITEDLVGLHLDVRNGGAIMGKIESKSSEIDNQNISKRAGSHMAKKMNSTVYISYR